MTEFNYPRHASQLPKKDSPIYLKYVNNDPRLKVDKSSGVVTSNPDWRPSTSP